MSIYEGIRWDFDLDLFMIWWKVGGLYQYFIVVFLSYMYGNGRERGRERKIKREEGVVVRTLCRCFGNELMLEIL